MPLDLTGKHTTDAIKETKPETTVGVHTKDGNSVKADVTTKGSWWSATAWYQWIRGKGSSAGADAEIKF